MKKWFKFFTLSFFSHKAAKEGARRGYTNVFLGFVLVLALLFLSFVGGEMLPFGVHYGNSPDFRATVHGVFANADPENRIDAEIEDGKLKLWRQGSEYSEALLLNTFESESDRQTYSANGFNVVVDTRSADTLAEIDAYCISSDGSGKRISYEEYLSLNEVARLNFDFKIEYTGNELQLDDKRVQGYREYLDGRGADIKAAAEKLDGDLNESRITKEEYVRAIYELYFVSYYPEITAYESNSKVPLLRNYYQQFINQGISNYLFIFDDYMAGSFETKSGIDITFYGFYSGLEDGSIVREGASSDEACASVDSFIKSAFRANWFLNAYTSFMNLMTAVPFIALMLLVATLLSYSVLKLCGVDSVASLGAMFKVVGSFSWFSGVVATVLALICSFFVSRSLIITLPLVLFFVTLLIRAIVFVIKERNIYLKQLEQQQEIQTEA